MARRAQEERVFNVPMEYLVQKMRAIDTEYNFTFRSENPMPGGVWFRVHHGASFTSWGEKVTVSLTPLSAQQTRVNILSECGMPTQIVDYGKNAQVVRYLFDYLAKGYMPTYAAQPNNAPGPAPARFCTGCGGALAPGARFCSKCGKPI